MSYCNKCGKPVEATDRFCKSCGCNLSQENTQNTDNSNNQRKKVFEGDIHKCPNCGGNVPAFQSICSLCGFEFRNAKSSNAVKEFMAGLSAIDNQRKISSRNKIKTKIDYIANYPIPNTKEDLLEFLILAASNIEQQNTSQYNYQLNDAWKSKYNQVLSKSKLVLGEASPEIEAVERSVKERKKSNNKSYAVYMLILLGLAVVMFAFGALLHKSNKEDDNLRAQKIAAENERLYEIVDEINEAIENEEFTKARTLVTKLVFNVEGYSSSITNARETWENTRTELYTLIDRTENPDSYTIITEMASIEPENMKDDIKDDEPDAISESESDDDKFVMNEYSYVCDESNVYIARILSDSTIKIEHWTGGVFSSKKSSYDSDLCTFKIDDKEYDFEWVESDKTAFKMKLQDKNVKKLKKSTEVIFSIDVDASDSNKGTNCTKNILSFSYGFDDYTEYRCVLLNENLLKVECWTRSFSIGNHIYAYDVDILELKDTDFEWTSDDHDNFTVTLKDVGNKELKKGKLTTFSKVKEKTKFDNVYDYIKSLD